MNSRFCSKTQWQMFLLVSGRHVGAHLGGHQHGVSIQISINLGKTFLRISSVGKIAVTWILAKVFAYLSSFYFQFLDLIYWTVLIFYFDLFWMAWHWKPAIFHITALVIGSKVSGVTSHAWSSKTLLKINTTNILSRFGAPFLPSIDEKRDCLSEFV